MECATFFLPLLNIGNKSIKVTDMHFSKSITFGDVG